MCWPTIATALKACWFVNTWDFTRKTSDDALIESHDNRWTYERETDVAGVKEVQTPAEDWLLVPDFELRCPVIFWRRVSVGGGVCSTE